MKLKQLICFGLILVLMLAMTVVATAEAVATVTVESAKVGTSEEFTLNISVKDLDVIKSMAIIPIYDSDILELYAGEWLLQGTMQENWSAEEGNAVIAFDDPTDVNGDVLSLSFRVKEGVEIGTATSVSCTVVAKYGADVTYETTVVSGKVTVVDTSYIGKVSVPSVKAGVGDDTTITVSISESAPLKSIAIIPKYDSDVIELYAGEWLLQGTMQENWSIEEGNAVIAFDSPTDVNGDIFTLSFRVKEGVEVDTTTAISCEVVTKNGTVEYKNIVSEGIVTVIDNSAKSTISFADMTLSTDIAVNYYAIIHPDHAGAQMKFTFNGDEFIVDGIATENENEYVYCFKGVPPQCMGDNIKAELVLDGKILDTKAEYSVKQYCENMLAKDAASLNISEEKFASLKTLIADLLEYGACAQIYQGYKTDKLVNNGIVGKSEFVELNPDDCEEILEKGSSFSMTGVEFVSAGVYYSYNNSLYVKFNAPGATESNFRIRLTDGEGNNIATYKLSDCELVSEANNTYRLLLPAISATQFINFYNIELCKYTSRSTTVQWTLNYGMSSFVCSKQNQVDSEGNLTPMALLARATYNYGLSAISYNTINN